jgi:hypothetical protein
MSTDGESDIILFRDVMNFERDGGQVKGGLACDALNAGASSSRAGNLISGYRAFS